ncbi:MAG: SUMF1/EgtB/PvdO family nonheme iron enzyme [Verrucomicrobia bacterium]|nr:SUMF1/EgtB/PvdO family nonheme iron enzyme [Verrucomicrobiota bacterium]
MEYDWSAFGEFTAGVSATAGLALGATYVQGRSPAAQWKWEPRPPEVTPDPFHYELNGAATATVRLVPKLDLRVNSLAGLWVNVDPRLEASGSARVVNHELESAQWRFAALADLNAGLSVIGVKDQDLPRLEPIRLFTWEKTEVYPATELRIHRPPQSLTVTEGQSATFSVDATANRPLTYQWFRGVVPVFSRPARLGDPRLLVLNPVMPGDAGEYWVRVRAGDQVADSPRATLTVRPREPRPIPGMVWIPPGTFTMGSPASERNRYYNEEPRTQVTLSRGFWLGKYEVTQREYLAVMGNNPSYFTGDLDRPVEQVSWNDAVAYCEKLTQQERAAGRLPEGYEYRLPTEAQWEYACRAGTTTRFSFGDALECDDGCGPCAIADQYMWWCGNSGNQTHRVGQKLPNAWGLYDMHGNVWEWCADWYSDSYPGGTVTDPEGPSSGSLRVRRGGSWKHFGQDCRSANRSWFHPSNSNRLLGFRAALVPVP